MCISPIIMKSSISAISITIFVTILMAPLTTQFVAEGSDSVKIKSGPSVNIGASSNTTSNTTATVDPMDKDLLSLFTKLKNLIDQLPKIEKPPVVQSTLGNLLKPQVQILVHLVKLVSKVFEDFLKDFLKVLGPALVSGL